MGVHKRATSRGFHTRARAPIWSAMKANEFKALAAGPANHLASWPPDRARRPPVARARFDRKQLDQRERADCCKSACQLHNDSLWALKASRSRSRSWAGEAREPAQRVSREWSLWPADATSGQREPPLICGARSCECPFAAGREAGLPRSGPHEPAAGRRARGSALVEGARCNRAGRSSVART